MSLRLVHLAFLAAFGLCSSLGCRGRHATLDRSPWQPPATETPVRIVATEAGYEAPSSIRPGLRHIVYENRGAEVHEAMFVKLPEGTTATEFVAAVGGGALFPKGALDYSGPGLTSPGESVELWLRLDPGRYILVCWIGDHATTRPVRGVTVEGPPSDDATPREDAVLRLIDYRFELAGRLQKGVQILRVETPGPSMHEVDVFRLEAGQSLDDMNRWYGAEGKGVPPMKLVGGVTDSHDIRRVVWLRRSFSPGRYALHCGMPMASSSAAGSEHTNHADVGMVREIEIAE